MSALGQKQTLACSRANLHASGLLALVAIAPVLGPSHPRLYFPGSQQTTDKPKVAPYPSAAGQQRSDTYRELKCALLSAARADINSTNLSVR